MGSLWKGVIFVFLLRFTNTTSLLTPKPMPVGIVKEVMSKIHNQTFGEQHKDGQKSSLAFVFDITGSMHNDLVQLREGAHMILEAVVQNPNAQISNFVLVPFEDPGYGPATVTEDRELFKEALNKLSLVGGGDCPEMSLSGIREALAVSQPLSFVYVFTDASATDHFILDSVLDQVQRKQSQIVFILTGDCKDREKPSFRAYHEIAAASSGQVFNLQKINVHKVLQFVKSSVAGRRVNLGSVTNPAGYNYTQAVPVDKSLGEVTVSVSGSNPQIKVIDPKGEEVTGPPKLVKTLDLDAIMVVNLINPEPGNWSITVGSRDQHSVKVTGLSDLTFQHGFSVQPPRGLRETSHRPLQGTDNYLMISPTETTGRVEMKFAEIVSTEGKMLFELPLNPLDDQNHLYLAGPFLPPDDFFYIAINGVDENMNNLRRIGATAIQPQLPDVPFLTVQHQIKAHPHEIVVLKCDIESLVPVTAQWYLGNSRLQNQISSLQSTSLEYAIQDMGQELEGSYKCVASNVAGFSKAVTNVTLLVDPPVVKMSPGNVTVPAYSSLVVACSVQSQVNLSSFKLIVINEEGTTLVDNRIPDKVDDFYHHEMQTYANISAKYACQASNRGGETSIVSYVEVLKPLKANIMESKSLITTMHSSFNLTCRIENGLAVLWTDPSGEVKTHNENLGIVQYDSVFIVHDVLLGDIGNWTCVTTRGTEKVSDSIEVILVPTVQTSNATTALYGEKVTITCTVTATAPVRIVWTNHNRETIPSNISSSDNAKVHISTITFDNVTKRYEGTYFCTAENVAGKEIKNVTLQTWQKQNVIEVAKDMKVDIYSSARLICHIQSHPPSVIRWYHNGTELPNSRARNDVYLSNTLQIYNMDFNKTGHYTCEASNQYETNFYNVSVEISGLENPEIDKSIRKKVAAEGETILISCRLRKGKPIPTISWQYQINASTEFVELHDHFSDNGKLINLTNIDVDQAGTYRCRADNILGTDSYDVSVVVQFPPQLETDQPEVPWEVAAGTSVTLPCRASGKPRPLITWTKDGMPLIYSDNVHLEDTGNVRIGSATEYDAGVFTCIASSSIGTARKNFTLVIVAPPTVAEAEGSAPELEVVEGSLVELSCVARGLPRPRLRWTHDNRTVAADSRRHIDDDFTLRFVANLTDFGEYRCLAVNKAGEASKTYLLFVWASPYVDVPFEVVESRVGAAVTLRCDAVGFPVPTISWTFDNAALANSGGITYNDTGYVSIDAVRSEHEGSYVCSATNLAGVAQKYIRLDVNEPPRIVGNASEYVALSSDAEMKIPCVATGKPRPHVLWSKDGDYISTDWRYSVGGDGSLSVRALSADVVGNYTCEASNRLGRATLTHRLQLYSVPKIMQMDESQSEVVMLEGSNHTLHCNVKHSPEDTVTWYNEGALVGEGELSFINVSRGAASLYACVAANAAGAASWAVRVRVEWPPAPPAAPAPHAAELLEGDDHYLACESDARPEGQIKWYFDSTRLPEDSNMMELRDVKLHHAGVYMCVVTNPHGTIQQTFNISVLTPPRIRGARQSEVELDFKQGSYATLQCAPSGRPTPNVTWLYNNTDWQVQNGSLVCRNTSQRSEGLFQCVARSRAGVASLMYKVHVLAPAVVREVVLYGDGDSTTVHYKAEVVAGKSVRIACSGDGSPPPEVRWIRNGGVASRNQPGVYYADLALRDPNQLDGGVYVCAVANDAGRQERTVQLDILTKPKIFKNIFMEPNATEPETIEVISGSPFRLRCHPYGNPLPSLYWFRDGALLRLYDDTLVTEEFGEVLVAGASTREQSGNYTCVARNKAGEDSVSYLLNVLVPPTSDSKDNGTVRVRTKEGMSVNLTCPSQGNPPPYIFWLKHPYTEINFKHFPKIDFEENNSSVVINNATSADSGKYTCIVTNKIGTLEVTFEVIVESPPVILTNGPTADDNIESTVVPLGRTVVLKCPVKGFPEPQITWLKDTVEVSGAGAARSVRGAALALAVAVRDAGQYICIADNAAGTVHRRFNVRVTVPGEWSEWSLWSLCNATCGRGEQWRQRLCHYVGEDGVRVVSRNVTRGGMSADARPPGVELDEAACRGAALHTRPCHMPPCEEEGEYGIGGVEVRAESCAWSAWGAWGACDAACGAGAQARRRRCFCPRASAPDCLGDDVQIRKCPNLPECKPMSSGSLETNSQEQYLPEVTYESEPERAGHPGGASRMDEDRPSDNDIGSDNNIHTVSNDAADGVNDTCRAGFTLNPSTGQCEDIDECLAERAACHSTQLCENAAGGYRCFCQPGYSSLGAGQRCLDLNECELETHRCEYACVNAAGGYVCACPRGLRLRADLRTCTDRRPHIVQSSVYGGVDAEHFDDDRYDQY